MSYEIGGRADKNGNRFENNYFIFQIIKVLKEDISSVTLEAIGDDEKGTDIWIKNKDGTRESLQCKGRYGSKDNWNLSGLNKYNILDNWRFQLERSKDNFVGLVSPISFIVLEDLISKVKNTNNNPNDFYNIQIKDSGKNNIDFFKSYCKSMKLNPENNNDLIKSIDYLKRTNYHQMPDSELKELVLDGLKNLFVDETDKIYNCLLDLIVNENILAKEVDIIFLRKYFKSKKLKFRNLVLDDRIMPRINQLNKEYSNFFNPISKDIIKRSEFEKCKEILEKGDSIILHGKAGYGKSGITELIVDYCKKREIFYIAIKLDKRIPNGNVEKWSRDLGLSASLGHCIDSVSKNRKAVIILDQLDALRWTQSHSRDSLLVCMDLINQIKNLNYYRANNISIIFICRTYDLENDNNIKALFKNNEEEFWNKIKIDKFEDEIVKNIVGKEYDGFSQKLKDLLKVPNNLYIWNQLEKNKSYDDCSTTNKLIKEWWYQLQEKCSDYDANLRNLKEAKNKLINKLDNIGRISIPEKVLDIDRPSLKYLSSNNFLINKNGFVSFSHQSLLDYFLAENMLLRYGQGENIIEIIGDKEKQTPSKRYQIQMFLEDLIEYDTNKFVEIGKELFESKKIRFYIKYIFFEILGQVDSIDSIIKNFIIEYCKNSNYENYIINNVIHGHYKYIRLLRKEGILDSWLLNPKKKYIVFNLLLSMRGNFNSEDVIFLRKCLFKSEEDSKKLFRCFNYSISEDSEDMFDLRMELYKKYPYMSDEYIDFKDMMKNCEMRTIYLFEFWLKNKKNKKNKQVYQYVKDILIDKSDIIINHDKEIIDILLKYIPKKLEHYYNGWSNRSTFSNGLERTCLEIIKKANINLIKKSPQQFINIYNKYMAKGYPIFNELILSSLVYLPLQYSNYIIEYLYKNFENNIFEESSGNGDELLLTKNILMKYSKTCDDNIFYNIESKILRYNPTNIIYLYNIHKKRNYLNQKVYFSFWGDLQIELLPCLEKDRLSVKSKNLIEVLNRKFVDGSSIYKYNKMHSGSVWSPIANKSLSNNQWVKLLTNKKITNKGEWKESAKGFIESSIREFSISFQVAVSEEPERFIKLILKKTNDILEEYIDSLYSGIASSKKINEIPIELLEDMFEKYPCNYESERAKYFCWIIKNKKQINWSKKVIDKLKLIALNHNDPKLAKPNVTKKDDKDIKGIDMLISNSLNCVRGCALSSIAYLLWENKELYEDFKEVIESSIKDVNSVIKFSSLYTLLPAYNIQKKWASERIIELFEEDIRFVGFFKSRQILFSIFKEYENRVIELVKKCYNSDYKKLIEVSSYIIAEMYILENKFLDIINDSVKMNEEQQNDILRMSINYFDNPIYNKKVKQLIIRFKDNKYNLENIISGLFRDDLIKLDRDKEFLLNIMPTNLGRRSVYDFINYIDKNSKSIIEYKDIILSLIESFIQNFKLEVDNIYYFENELSKLIIGLYDETIGREESEMKDIANKCLDIWDEMFEKQIGSIRELSRKIIDR